MQSESESALYSRQSILMETSHQLFFNGEISVLDVGGNPTKSGRALKKKPIHMQGSDPGIEPGVVHRGDRRGQEKTIHV